MKGSHRVIVSTKRMRYDFIIRRNITVIRGDSATGKTALIEMIQEHSNNAFDSAVEVSCDKTCHVLSGALWREQLAGMNDSIVFIDEGNEFVKTDSFSKTIQDTDNYYVIVAREGLPSLPYSVEEVYGIRSSGKYSGLKPCYHEFYRIYGLANAETEIYPECVITEDRRAGYQFFERVCGENGIRCISADGKSNIFQAIRDAADERILIIADGASFGSEIDKVSQILANKQQCAVYLPESFEWIILDSGILKDREVNKILETPADYIESRDYFSWERFFTALLTNKTRDSYLKYSKKELNPAYTEETSKKRILGSMQKIHFTLQE